MLLTLKSLIYLHVYNISDLGENIWHSVYEKSRVYKPQYNLEVPFQHIASISLKGWKCEFRKLPSP